MEHIKDLNKAFGLRIRNLRKKKSLSQEDLADRAGLHPTYVGGVERGERNPSLESILKIARALEISPGQLFKFEGVKTSLNLDEQIVDEILGLVENLKPSTKRRILGSLRSVMRDIKI